ncbi:MAG: hypothetical protein HYS81_01140 [Candidatus Aenigmatarchaeota archaeon]|nr:MAG: hypothetical protein HYS81_01140 [Candidatus Aenigmarchaeota archaeon]
MDWTKALTLGIADYIMVFMLLMAADLAYLSRSSMEIVAVVLNLFLVLFLAYYYFRWVGVRTKNDGIFLGGSWVVVAFVLEAALGATGFSRGPFVGDVSFWLYSFERLALPMVFSSGLIEIKGA